MIVYLSGAMEFAEDEGANWRKDLSSWLDINLGHKAFDPVVNSKKLITNKVVTQGYFLKKLGILQRAEIISRGMTFKEKTDLYYRLDRLLNPKNMGENFKVLFAQKKREKFNFHIFF